jgi:hypothetical protein
MSLAEGLFVFVLSFALPITFTIYLFRTLGAIVDGLRSINAGIQKMSATLDRLEAGRGGAPM